MKSESASFFWRGDAKWITIPFIAYLLAIVVFVFSGFSKAILSGTSLFSALMCFSACAAGLNSSRLFGGRKNFTGRLLFFLSVSVFSFGLLSLDAIFHTYFAQNAFVVSGSLDGELIVGFFALAFFIAAYALLISARAVAGSLNATVLSRFLFALLLTSVVSFFSFQAESRLTPGVTILNLLQADFPFVLSTLVLSAAALILIAQLGKWYATPGISLVASGYMVLSIVPSLVRAGLLLSGIKYEIQLALFLGTLTMTLYLVGLGLNKVRPVFKGPIGKEKKAT